MVYSYINSGEQGLSVRIKLNEMLKGLIDGVEGVNAIWRNLNETNSDVDSLEVTVQDNYYTLKEQLLNNLDHTDASIEDLRLYINAISGGVCGFATDTDYVPDFPEDKNVTVLAAGSGTYTHFLDMYGNPITIEDSDAITIFYRAAYSDFWLYKSVFARVVVNEDVDGGTATRNKLIQLRGDTLNNFNAANPLLGNREVALVKSQDKWHYDSLKIGNGLDEFNNLSLLRFVHANSITLSDLEKGLQDRILALYTGYYFMGVIGEAEAQLIQISDLFVATTTRKYVIIQYLRDNMVFRSSNGELNVVYNPKRKDRAVFLYYDYFTTTGHQLTFIESNIPLADSINLDALTSLVNRAESAVEEIEGALSFLQPVVLHLDTDTDEVIYKAVSENLQGGSKFLVSKGSEYYSADVSYVGNKATINYFEDTRLVSMRILHSGGSYLRETYYGEFTLNQ